MLAVDRRSTSNVIIIFVKPTSTKPQAEILTLNKVNGCNDVSFADHSVLEGDRIPPLKSHGQALEEELTASSDNFSPTAVIGGA